MRRSMLRFLALSLAPAFRDCWPLAVGWSRLPVAGVVEQPDHNPFRRLRFRCAGHLLAHCFLIRCSFLLHLLTQARRMARIRRHWRVFDAKACGYCSAGPIIERGEALLLAGVVALR